ncbi:MAG: hypothetical protein WCE79_14120 [Xanthobacteraceae bacterium]
MPQIGPDSERNTRGAFYAVVKRVRANKDFFDRAWKLQVKCCAIFGPEMEETFLLVHKARRSIEVSAEMLMRDPYPMTIQQRIENYGTV